MNDYVIRGTAADGQVLAFACSTTNMVEEARQRHGLSKVATAALGRAMSGVTMMSVGLKKPYESITLTFSGNGPLGTVVAMGDGGGRVRGYVGNPQVELPLNSKGKLDVGGAVGLGLLNVEKDLHMKEPFVGTTILATSEIAEDLAYYFTTSEQIPSAVALGVLVHDNGQVWTAGGFIIQLLPGASDEVAQELQDRCTAFPQLTSYLAEGHTPEDVLEELLKGMDYIQMDKQEVRFKCFCNKQKVESALVSIGREELDQLIADDETIEMSCHFCNEKYYFTPEELRNIRAGMDVV
ncbi:MAG: Hsp33 family molecular chaperone HslO [Lachnospiraceae bacterium]|nr:Hsp33 family molecular chaperone HslO [Lachnospiraceae bacterium]